MNDLKRRFHISATRTLLFFGLLLTIGLVGCNKDTEPETPPDDDIELLKPGEFGELKIVYDGSITVEQLKDAMNANDMAAMTVMLGGDLRLYKVVYSSQYPEGTPVKASGVVIMPTERYDKNFPTIVYQHGTWGSPDMAFSAFKNGDTPDIELLAYCALSSVFGAAVLIPDYIGYGESRNIIHPYVHRNSLARAGFDFIMAMKNHSTDSFALNSELVLCGYSEGGYATVALQEMIQQHPEAGMKVSLNVAGSGPYDQVSFVKEIMSPDKNTFDKQTLYSYLWVLDTYKRNCGYTADYSTIFTPATYQILADNDFAMAYYTVTMEQYNLPTNPGDLFRADFRADISKADSDNELLTIARSNSLTDFVPADSLILVYGTADEWVFPSNAVNTYAEMSKNGGKVLLRKLEHGEHRSTYNLYLTELISRLWMMKLR